MKTVAIIDDAAVGREALKISIETLAGNKIKALCHTRPTHIKGEGG